MAALPTDTTRVERRGISIPLSAAGPWWLVATAVLSVLLYYFIGIDQGAVSVFGNDMHIHEFVHDARHFIGFPCH
jgi:hypothetical protein